MNKKMIAVVGGGLAGLTAAYTLLKEGHVDVHVFEEKSFVGGRVQSREIRGRTIDFGGFLIYPWYTESHKLFGEIDIEKLLVKTPLSDIFYFLGNDDGAQKEDDITFPLGEGVALWAKSLLKILPTPDLARPDLELFERKTISEYLRSTIGDENHASVYESFFDTVGQGYCYGPVDQVKAAFMAPIVRQITFHGDVESTSFFPEGCGTIADCLVEKIVALGGHIHVNTPITGIDGLTLRSGDQKFWADAVIFAQTVSKDLYEQILPGVDTECWYTHFVTVAVELLETPVVGGTQDWGAAFYAPNVALLEQAVSMINTESLYGPPLDSCVILNILLRNRGSEIFDDAELQSLVHRELHRLSLDVQNEKILSHIHWTQTMPVAQEAFVQSVRDAHGKNGLYFAGDFLGAPSIETAMATGRKAAEDVLRDSEKFS